MAKPKPHVATGPAEKDLLRDFWFHVTQTTDRQIRLDWLKRLAAIHVRVKWGWKHEEVRERWNRQRDWLHGPCFVCAKVKPLQTHHIIQIRFGGSNLRRNRVTICKTCHGQIHPWMTARQWRAAG